jgi:hypothetical protein
MQLENPSVTARIALVTNAVQPCSVLTRALIQTAHNADVDSLLSAPLTPADG